MSEVKKIATRASYGNALVELGKKHEDLIVLDADLAAAFLPKRKSSCLFLLFFMALFPLYLSLDFWMLTLLQLHRQVSLRRSFRNVILTVVLQSVI